MRSALSAPAASLASPLGWRVLRGLTLCTLLGWATGCASLPANTQRTPSTAFNAPHETALGQLVAARRAQAGARSESAFRLVDNVEIALTSRLALVEGALRSLDLQYYAIHADASTEVLLQAIRDAARRGVRVRLLLDDFNSVGEDAQVLRLAFEPNIEVRLFNPLPGPRNNMLGRLLGSLHDIPRIQKRMHNKVFIADNAWGITGGRNLGDRYFGSGDKQNFVDLDVLAAGAIVRDMSASFDRFWNNELAYPVQSLLDPQDLDNLRKLQTPEAAAGGRGAIRSAATAAPASGAVLPNVTAQEVAQADRRALDLRTVELRWAPAALLVDKPGKVAPDDDEVNAQDTLIDGLLSLMQVAQKDVLIVSPYFVPGAQMMSVYEQLRKRGVRIRVLTNSLASNDAPAAHAGYARYRRALIAMGVELYEMRSDPAGMAGLAGSSGGGAGGSKSATDSRASLHSKAVFIDNRLAVIGSMNLDLRSQLQNSEVALVIRSGALTQEATRAIETTFAQSAYRVEERFGQLRWRAPPGASFPDAFSEPGASAKQRLMSSLVAPFAPDAML